MASNDSNFHSIPNSSFMSTLNEGSVVASRLNELASSLKFGQWAISLTPAIPSNPIYLTSYNIDQTHFFSEGSVITKQSCSTIKDLGVHEGEDLAKGVDLDKLSSVSSHKFFSSLQQSQSSYQSQERILDCLGLEKNLSATGSNNHIETTLEASSGQHQCIEFQYSQKAAGTSSANVLQTSRDWRSEARFQQGRNEAKMRYHEKKKTRMFTRQIRYASRKAVADTRRRVKGRFVKA